MFSSPSRAPLLQVSQDGGTPEPVTVLDAEWGETSHRQPAFLPGGHAVVFLAEGTGRKSRVVVQLLETGERHVLVDDATRPHYSPSGHLIYLQGGATMAAPFDLERLELTGPGVPILPDEATYLSVSDTGTLTYLATDISRAPQAAGLGDSHGRARVSRNAASLLYASSPVPGWAASGGGH